MSNLAIQCVGIGKQYRIGELESYKALRDVITDAVKSPFRRLRQVVSAKGRNCGTPTIWALRDISFEVKQGEVIGIIGRNGAGKSTLLKILARITEPTCGHVDIEGRVGSLLEVGTGFHPELTGRENIFLNGAILGMSKAEIARKFDEIVAFAEIERFIDTPVKRYSSGMYVRLAFAVAAHLEPEILLVDEVLAVGDASFQKKCLGKMGQVSREGRTILFVSHNMAAVKALCRKAVFIQDGVVAAFGGIAEVSDEYLAGAAPGESVREWPDPATAPGNDSVRLCYVRILPPQGKSEITVDTGAQVEIGVENFRENINLGCTIYVSNREGVLIFESGHCISSDCDSRCGFYQLTGTMPSHLLNAGNYSVDLVFGKDQRYVLLRSDAIVSFTVENTTTGRGANMEVAPGVVRPLLSWRHSLQEVPLFREQRLISETASL